MINSFFLTPWFGRFFSQPSEKYSECFLVDGLISGFLGILSLLLFVLGVASSNQRPGIRSTKNPFLCPDHVSIFANLNEQNFFSVWENLAKSDDLAREVINDGIYRSVWDDVTAGKFRETATFLHEWGIRFSFSRFDEEFLRNM